MQHKSAVIAALKAKMQQLERYLKLFIGILDIILAISNEWYVIHNRVLLKFDITWDSLENILHLSFEKFN